jgi:Xaa-Pro dipeptidase
MTTLLHEVMNTGIKIKELHKLHVAELCRRYQTFFEDNPKVARILIHSGIDRPWNSVDDQSWPVKLTPHFSHWTPYRGSEALLEVLPGRRPVLYLNIHNSYWEGAAPSPENWSVDSFDVHEGTHDFIKIASTHLNTTFLIGDYWQQTDLMKQSNLQTTSYLDQLNRFRTQKSPYEVSCIKEASIIGARGHRAIKEAFLGTDHSKSSLNQSEFMLQSRYHEVTHQTLFDVPYGSILAANRNVGILHHVHYSRDPIPQEASLLIDAGATYHGYASDITRTWIRGNSKFSILFAELVQRVTELHKNIIKMIRVGDSYESLHDKAHDGIAEIIVAMKMSQGSRESLIVDGVTRAFFPHGLGHSLGLQVHDIGMRSSKPKETNPYLRNTSHITQGQVFTIEPGFYFIPQLLMQLKDRSKQISLDWELIEGLSQFGGVRIEDNIYVNQEGQIENLTPEI